MQLIQTQTLTSAQASITFTSIPQDGTDLVAWISPRGTLTNNIGEVRLSLNGSTSGFSRRDLQGNGSAVQSSASNDNYIGEMGSGSYTANAFSSTSLYIPNYTGSRNKSYSVDVVTENNATAAQQRILAGLWSNTAAITSLTISAASGDTMAAGSMVSLYKITKGSDGIVTTSP